MSSRPKNRFFSTLSLRLTILYCVFFALSTVIAFSIIYALTDAVLQENIDNDLREDAEALSVLLEKDGLEGLKKEILWEVQTDGSEQVFFRLFDNDGKVLFNTDISAWKDLEDSLAQVRLARKQSRPVFSDMSLNGDETRARIIVAQIGDDLVLQIGEALGEGEEYLDIFTAVFGKVMIIMFFVSALCGWFMARRAMMGVEEVTQTALNIARGEFSQRVPVKSRGYEIERLATAFNDMIDRIQSLLNGIREVTDNIAHDLRSPLASLRGTTEMTLMSASTVREYREMAENTIEECDRLIAMINAMLDISEAEAGASSLEIESINICQLVKQACDLFMPVAEDKELSLDLQGPANCYIEGDLKKIQRLVSNLLDNALKYTSPGEAVKVNINSFDDHIELVVEDNGVGIDEKDLPFIFQRFYRCDESRAQEGSGLGLSLVQAIVKVHQGDIDVTSRIGSGSRFIVKLPVHLNVM